MYAALSYAFLTTHVLLQNSYRFSTDKQLLCFKPLLPGQRSYVKGHWPMTDHKLLLKTHTPWLRLALLSPVYLYNIYKYMLSSLRAPCNLLLCILYTVKPDQVQGQRSVCASDPSISQSFWFQFPSLSPSPFSSVSSLTLNERVCFNVNRVAWYKGAGCCPEKEHWLRILAVEAVLLFFSKLGVLVIFGLGFLSSRMAFQILCLASDGICISEKSCSRKKKYAHDKTLGFLLSVS